MEFRGGKFEEGLKEVIQFAFERDPLKFPDEWNGHALIRGSCGLKTPIMR